MELEKKQESKIKITLGIDLGPTSIGMAFIDENANIHEKPIVIHFNDQCDLDGHTNNSIRRNFRHIRRTINRKRARKKALQKLFQKELNINWEQINKNKIDIYKTKIKGLNEKLSNEEIAKCLYHYFKHRGHFHHSILKSDIQKFPTEILLENKNEQTNKIIGIKSTDECNFSNKDWMYEIDKFCNQQELSTKFKEDFFKIFTYRKDYRHGPGSEKHPATKYGLDQKQWQSNKNLWDKLVGKCSIFKDEDRASISTCTHEIFSFLEKINNLSLFNKDSGEVFRINKEQKISLFKYFIDEKEPVTNTKFYKKLCEVLNLDYKKKQLQFQNKKRRKNEDSDWLPFDKKPYLKNTCFFSKLLNLSIFNNNEFDKDKIKKINVKNTLKY